MMQIGDSREIELQNLLRDERDRCNQYKQIYQTLKGKHDKLQDELTLIHDQLKDANLQRERQAAENESKVRKLEAKIKEQQGEIKKLKAQDEKKIRAEVLSEATSHYEGKMKELQLEVEKTREQYNDLHYKNVVLKCDFDSREADYSRSLERINQLHQGEIEQLKSKIESLENDKSSPTDNYALELKSSKWEILQLNSKVRTLLSECVELRAQNDRLSLQISSLIRTNTKQTADHEMNMRLLESEKQKIAGQKENVEKELTNWQEHRRLLSNELQASKREVLSLRSKLEACEHKCHMSITDLQVEMKQWKSASESDLEQYVEEIARLKCEVQTASTMLTHERQVMASQEQDLQQNLLAAKQQLFKQTRELHQEKESLERNLKKIIAEKDNLISNLRQDILSLTQQLNIFSSAKVELEKKLLNREQLDAKKNLTEYPVNEIPSKQNLNYEKEIHNLKEKLNKLMSSESNAPEHEIIQMKLNWEQQKLQQQQRLEELESHLREIRSTSASEKRELEFKLKQYTKEIVKLRERLDLQKIENEELKFQKNVLEKNVPPEIHSQVRNQLMELQRRVQQYQRLITLDPNSIIKNISTEPFPEKLLTDITNIQFQTVPLQPPGEASNVFLSVKENGKDKVSEKYSPKKDFRHRRKSLKLRERNYLTKTGEPIISSTSSDLDLENL